MYFLMLLLCASACQAIPIWINRYHTQPMIHFLHQPSISYGSGFSSDIGGHRHSSGVAFQSGNGQAYGAGVSDGGNSGAFARAIASPPTMFPYYYTVPAYSPSFSALPSASSLALAPRFNGLSSASSSSSTGSRYKNAAATSTAHSHGSQSFPGHNLAVSSAQNINGQKSSFSMSQLQNGGGFKSAVSLANDFGGVKSSMAQATQVQGAAVQHSGATSMSAPGFQNAQSHALGYGSF